MHRTHLSGHQSTHQHVCGVEVVLARHVGLQPLRHLLDALDLVQQLEDVLVLDALDPQLPQLVPFAVQQHLAGQEVLLHLQEGESEGKSRLGRHNTGHVDEAQFWCSSSNKERHFGSVD